MKQYRGEGHDSLVYAVDCGLAIKIGVSTSLKYRIATYRMANPLPVRLLFTMPGGFAEERRVHRLLEDKRLEGEWFRAEPAEVLLAFAQVSSVVRGH